MNATNIVVRPQQSIKEIRLQTAARMGTFAALKSAVLVEDSVIGVEPRGGGMGLNKHEKPGRTRLPGGVGRIGDAQ